GRRQPSVPNPAPPGAGQQPDGDQQQQQVARGHVVVDQDRAHDTDRDGDLHPTPAGRPGDQRRGDRDRGRRGQPRRARPEERHERPPQVVRVRGQAGRQRNVGRDPRRPQHDERRTYGSDRDHEPRYERPPVARRKQRQWNQDRERRLEQPDREDGARQHRPVIADELPRQRQGEHNERPERRGDEDQVRRQERQP